MTAPVTLPLWLFVLILLFAAVTFASHFLFPSVRWFLRRRMERAVAQLNTRLQRPIEPFRLLGRYDLIQRLIYDPDVTQAIVEHARREKVREDVAFQRARAYAREIVPSFSAFTYFSWGVRAARMLSNALYSVRIVQSDEAGLATIGKDATVIFVMNHRSNMDYVLVTHLASDRSALSYAAGEWAQVWPLSALFKAMGAYFIRRKSRNNLYRRVLRRYVQMATENGVTQAMYPEGGLSLDGSLKSPKLGLLTYITEDLSLADRDVVFVPVALNYDRVLEDRVLIAAQDKGQRKFDARVSRVSLAVLRHIWLRLTGRFKTFGYAAVSFGAPVSLREEPGLSDDAEALSLELMRRIAAIVPVLPVPLVAHVLLRGPTTRTALTADVAAALAALGDHPVHLPHAGMAQAVTTGLQPLIDRGAVIETEDGQLRIAPEEDRLVRFYANSIAHLFPCAPAGLPSSAATPPHDDTPAEHC
ncbi:1-acyl-sn-glycerol-3-phosphate acyltransferase [Cognatishimia sp. F0-27]|uniref:1-acyl-sn-glycerol-3-phosphate acyltransferase n=1 Tax=Cognatishimia sp. F0-27 TaxID=2816855 RepID=UPI001D0C212B|nr:1-acyl-sn-glycerol-3-phosphate acyltransferase [Cognatishimia sp. F0-27]MCC1491662.1 1-acyl-sn-glycerol-3-phosphate acyltransferase [Cognatishimia sp. F0-27]